MSTPGASISSLSCWKPISCVAAREQRGDGNARWRFDEARRDRAGDAPALEQPREVATARAGRVADAARGEHGVPHGILAA